jgi:hypothetical protein
VEHFSRSGLLALSKAPSLSPHLHVFPQLLSFWSLETGRGWEEVAELNPKGPCCQSSAVRCSPRAADSWGTCFCRRAPPVPVSVNRSEPSAWLYLTMLAVTPAHSTVTVWHTVCTKFTSAATLFLILTSLEWETVRNDSGKTSPQALGLSCDSYSKMNFLMGHNQCEREPNPVPKVFQAKVGGKLMLCRAENFFSEMWNKTRMSSFTIFTQHCTGSPSQRNQASQTN